MPLAWRKALFFRLAAILLGLAPFVVLELALRAAGIGVPLQYDDPFVGFSDIHPLFALNTAADRYEIPKSRQTHFRPESFPAKKPVREFRTFVLGGSTVQGRPYAIETSFTTWLELALQAAEPERAWDVVNCGGISYASYRLAPILNEVLQHDPDLIILCIGQNEFLEDRSYEHIESLQTIAAGPLRQAARLRTFTLARAGYLWCRDHTSDGSPANRPTLGPEADARLDWQGGMALFHRDPDWQRDVIAHYQFNLQRMVDQCAAAGVPLVMVTPISNLEWPPFKSEPRENLTPAEQAEFAALTERAAELLRSDLAGALEQLQAAERIDSGHARLQYDIGMTLRSLQRPDEARTALTRAKDADVCPLRMLEPMRRIFRETARAAGTPLVDAEAEIAARSRSGYPDNEWLLDHVHPTIEGHQLIGDLLAQKLAELQVVRLPADWEARRAEAYRRHLQSLDPLYFQKGLQRLENEQGWARGRSPAMRPEQPDNSR